MKRDFLKPLVSAVENWLDDSFSQAEYERFMQKGVERLGRALTGTGEQPAWAGELSLALANLEQTSISVNKPRGLSADAMFKVPREDQASSWLEERADKGLIVQGGVERLTAIRLLSLVQAQGDARNPGLKPALETLLRHVELRRKDSLRLQSAGSPIEHWFEKHDAAILLARSARYFKDLRYLNAAMKLTDWALPVHRRSVPSDLLARYLLALSEVQLAYEVLL